MRTSRLRIRFNGTYNFREGNLFKFIPEQKVNLEAPTTII